MARIRTIKPEFPQSESIGRLSRDARLLFIELWPICDDHGRTRAAPRMLASTLFPYDDDAKDGIESWLDELERESCIRRYEVGGCQYLEICNWLNHQKIDKPSKPLFPEPSTSPREDSRVSAEPSALEGKGKERKGGEGKPSPADSVPAGTPACPHDEIIALYHELLPMGAQVKTWTDTRRSHLRSRWREDAKRQNLDYWRRLFSHVAASAFLTGRASGRNGRPFSLSLDWLVKSENFAKVIEGRYHDKDAA